MSLSISFLSVLSMFIDFPTSSASSVVGAINNSTALFPVSNRPAAFIRGAMVKTTSITVSFLSFFNPATSIMALIPGRGFSLITCKP